LHVIAEERGSDGKEPGPPLSWRPPDVADATALILSKTNSFRVLLPNAFISHDAQLSAMLDPLWNHPSMKRVERYGGSFWIAKGTH
jgi:hypothetical protein